MLLSNAIYPLLCSKTSEIERASDDQQVPLWMGKNARRMAMNKIHCPLKLVREERGIVMPAIKVMMCVVWNDCDQFQYLAKLCLQDNSMCIVDCERSGNHFRQCFNKCVKRYQYRIKTRNRRHLRSLYNYAKDSHQIKTYKRWQETTMELSTLEDTRPETNHQIAFRYPLRQLKVKEKQHQERLMKMKEGLLAMPRGKKHIIYDGYHVGITNEKGHSQFLKLQKRYKPPLYDCINSYCKMPDGSDREDCIVDRCDRFI